MAKASPIKEFNCGVAYIWRINPIVNMAECMMSGLVLYLSENCILTE